MGHHHPNAVVLANGVIATEVFLRSAELTFSRSELDDLARHLSDQPDAGRAFSNLQALRRVPWKTRASDPPKSHEIVYLWVSCHLFDYVFLLDLLDSEASDVGDPRQLERAVDLCLKIMRLLGEMTDLWGKLGPM